MAQARPLRILVCDDEPAICDLLALIGARKGHYVASCHSARFLLEALEMHRPVAALVDLNWGETDGMTVVNTLRRHGVQRILALSGAVDLETRADAADVDGFIAKPFRLHVMEQLFDDLARHL